MKIAVSDKMGVDLFRQSRSFDNLVVFPKSVWFSFGIPIVLSFFASLVVASAGEVFRVGPTLITSGIIGAFVLLPLADSGDRYKSNQLAWIAGVIASTVGMLFGFGSFAFFSVVAEITAIAFLSILSLLRENNKILKSEIQDENNGPSKDTVQIVCNLLEDPTEVWTISNKHSGKDFVNKTHKLTIFIQGETDVSFVDPGSLYLTNSEKRKLYRSSLACLNTDFQRKMGLIPTPEEILS